MTTQFVNWICSAIALTLITQHLSLASPSGWVAQAPPLGQNLLAISFSDDAHGIVVGVAGTILTTTDGGNTWIDGQQPVPNNLYAGP